MAEPTMLAQKPSSSHFQSTSHVLKNVFNDLFVQDVVDSDTIRNLSASRRGNNDYHDNYVERLLQVQSKWSQSLDRSHKLQSYFNKAASDARELEAKEYEEKVKEFESYTDLGLPPVLSKFKVFINDNLMKEHNLISPNQILDNSQAIRVGNAESGLIRQYESSTFSSRQLFDPIEPEDCYKPNSPIILPKNSSVVNGVKPHRNELKKSSKLDPTKDTWRSCINPLQRDVEKKEMKNLQNKADFLKNPRFVDTPKLFLNKTLESMNLGSSMEYFKPYPCPVVFTGYEIHETYHVKLELKNITSSCRQVRILQPHSKHFSVSQGDFPTEDALVAPGMSCSFMVTFTPDTLGNYDDVLTVKTQAKEPIFISLRASREPPSLSLPEHLECGFSLVGDMKVVEFDVRNDGGDGRFCFSFNNDDHQTFCWDEMEYEEEKTIENLPFTISPSQFRLSCGENIKLRFTFKPAIVRSFSVHVTLNCDNCTQKKYVLQGKGEMPHIELKYVEDGISEPCLGEMYDQTAQQIIRFGDNYPGMVYRKELHIQNTISVPLKYRWDIHLPSVSSFDEKDREANEGVFSIEPKSGYLSGNANEKFMVVFSPTEIGHFYDVASLVLVNIPVKQSDGKYIFQNEIVMKLSMKGSTQEYTANVNPASVVMSGNYFIDKSYYRSVTLYNSSNAPTSFMWEEIDDDNCVISFSPSEGPIGANESVECLLTVQGKKVEQVQYLIEYIVPFSVKHVMHFQCNFKGPSISFLESSLSFGLVRFGTIENCRLTLVNNSPIVAKWKIFHDNEKITGTESAYIFDPAQGLLDAEATQEITVSFSPALCSTISDIFTCVIDNGKTCWIPVHAEVVRPKIYLEECEVMIQEAFLNVPVTKKITLVNANLLTAVFQWDFKNVDASVLSVSCEPHSGELKSHEKVDVFIEFQFHTLGEVEYLLVCNIEEMLEPVVLCVKAEVYGLNVEITMPCMQDIKNEKEVVRNNDILEFGYNNSLGEPVDAFIIIENKSAIETTFTVFAKEFMPPKVPEIPKKESKKVQGSSGHPLISRRFSTSQNQKSEEQEKRFKINSILQSGKGIAFVCSPSTGTLLPFETKIINVTVFTDMWGEYKDTLICQIGAADEKSIPIHIDVIGCPLNFQMSKEQPAMVRFGSHISGDKSVVRNLRINNTSHLDIRLDWKTFVMLPDDKKLIDLNVYLGEPFPICDETGNEIFEEKRLDREMVKVVIDEHYGDETDVPFSIINSQVVIPGKGSRSIDVSFKPPIGILEETKYLGYALGYMTLQGEDCMKSGLYNRQHGLDMFPFSVNMNGSVKPAKLHLEPCGEEDGFLFRLSASALLDCGVTGGEIRCEKCFILSNRYDTSLEFFCKIETPFKIVKTSKGKIEEKEKIVLKPQENIELEVTFSINIDLAASIYNKENNQIHTEFSTVFTNGGSQVYRLTGMVQYPSITVCEKIIYFGVCFIGGKKERCFTVSNSSNVMLRWHIEKDSSCPLTSLSVFSISTTDGTLDGDVAGTTGSDIKVYFHPKHNVEYECVLLISSMFRRLCLKEEPIQLVLRGAGSYDEAHKGRSDTLIP